MAGYITLLIGKKESFLIFGVACLLIALWTLFMMKNSEKHNENLKSAIRNIIRKDRVYFAEFKEFFKSGKVSIMVGMLMLIAGMWSEFVWALEPVLIDEVHASPKIGGIILSAFIAPWLLEYPIGRWIDKHQKRFFALASGPIVGGLGIVLFSFVTNVLVLIVASVVMAIGFAFFYVAINGLFDTLSNHHRRGHMAGVWQTWEDIGFVVGPVLGGVLAEIFGMRGAFTVFGFGLLFIVLWLRYERRTIKQYEVVTRL